MSKCGVRQIRSSGISIASVDSTAMSLAVMILTSWPRCNRYFARFPFRSAPMVLNGGKYQETITIFKLDSAAGAPAGLPWTLRSSRSDAGRQSVSTSNVMQGANFNGDTAAKFTQNWLTIYEP